MIKIVSIDYAGGACPYQMEGKTDKGDWIYIRYRDGVLRYVVRKTAAHWGNPNEPWYDYSKKVGEDLDGYASHDEIYPHLKDKIEFPEGFKIESYPTIEPDNNK